jgi:hypothetical protein
MNESPFRISGQERREKKKELSFLKSYVKNFWHYEDIDRVYGGGLDDSLCQLRIDEAQREIKELESELSEPATAIKREEKLNELGITTY